VVGQLDDLDLGELDDARVDLKRGEGRGEMEEGE